MYWSLQSDKIRNNIKLTNLRKYGVENILQSTDIRKKIIESRLDSSYDNLIYKLKDFVVPLFTREEFEGRKYYDKKYKWKCLKCRK